ncbi:MAG: SoxR reducing system RseC family protein [Clostridia bacterium]|nr:SoxR reducing system RseC family protein [Clostridia bacterium]
MQQEAKAVRILENGTAEILVRRKTACASDCDGCHGCAHPDETITVMAYNEVGAAAGDTVIVESSTSQVLGMAVLLYIMPVLLMLLGYLLPFGSEGAKIISSMTGLLLGLAVCIWVSHRMKKNSRMSFRIVDVIASEETNLQ